MATARKNIGDMLVPGLYPGWRMTPDFTTDTFWIEGPQGYVARISRLALEECGGGLDGVLEFILQKDARIKREASLQVPLYEQARKLVELEVGRELEQKRLEAQMCATKGATPVATMAAREDYLKYLSQVPPTRESIRKIGELAGMSPTEVEKVMYQPAGVAAMGQQKAEQGRLNKARADTIREMPHKPWNGVREVDLD